MPLEVLLSSEIQKGTRDKENGKRRAAKGGTNRGKVSTGYSMDKYGVKWKTKQYEKDVHFQILKLIKQRE